MAWGWARPMGANPEQAKGPGRCIITRDRRLPEVRRLVLLLGAVDLPVPAVGEGPRLVAFPGQHGVVAGLAGAAEGGHHGHLQVARDGLVGSRGVALVESELLGGPGRKVFARRRHRGVHVLVGEGGGRLRRCAGLERGVGVVGHATRVVAAASEVAVGQGGGARWRGALRRGRARAALLDSRRTGLSHARAAGGRLARRVGGAAAAAAAADGGAADGAPGAQRGRVAHQVPALVGCGRCSRRCCSRRRVEAGFHVLVDLLQAVVVEEHDGRRRRRLDPAGMEEHRGGHRPSRIDSSLGVALWPKAPETAKSDPKSGRLEQG